MKNIPLHWKIILGLILGVLWSIASAKFGWADFTNDFIHPFGEVFIRLLKLIAIPLVLFSIITGVTSLKDVRKLGRMGSQTIGMYLGTTFIAVTIGLLLSNLINPGKKLTDKDRLENRIKYEVWAKKSQTIIRDGECLSCDSSNTAIVERVLGQPIEEDENIKAKIDAANKLKENGPLQMLVDFVPESIVGAMSNMSKMLQVIVFALLFGIALISLKPEVAKSTIELCASANEAFLKLVEMVMKGAPFFIFALTAGVFSKMAGDDLNSLLEIFKGLGIYMTTVIIGLSLMIFVIYPFLLARLTKNKYGYSKFFKAISPAQFLAFSSSSSAATLPVTLECVTDKLKIPKTVADFVLPIGATMNMNGTSLYQAVATVFLAQMHGIELDISQYVLITITATLASVGSAAVPSAGLVMLVMVLSAIGLNPAWIAILFPVDRILDMSRTVVNVTGDIVVSAVVHKWNKGNKID